MPRRATAIAAYVVCLVIAFAILDNDYADWEGAVAIAVAGGLILGFGADFWTAAALSLLSPVLALPFGSAEKFLGSDAPQIWFAGAILIPVLILAILVGVGIRRIWGPPTRSA